jgi:hypothetical protein
MATARGGDDQRGEDRIKSLLALVAGEEGDRVVSSAGRLHPGHQGTRRRVQLLRKTPCS